jgi:hypothetical protein
LMYETSSMSSTKSQFKLDLIVKSNQTNPYWETVWKTKQHCSKICIPMLLKKEKDRLKHIKEITLNMTL